MTYCGGEKTSQTQCFTIQGIGGGRTKSWTPKGVNYVNEGRKENCIRALRKSPFRGESYSKIGLSDERRIL